MHRQYFHFPLLPFFVLLAATLNFNSQIQALLLEVVLPTQVKLHLLFSSCLSCRRNAGLRVSHQRKIKSVWIFTSSWIFIYKERKYSFWLSHNYRYKQYYFILCHLLIYFKRKTYDPKTPNQNIFPFHLTPDFLARKASQFAPL